MKKSILAFSFLTSYYLAFSQNSITAKIEIDSNQNLKVTQNIDKKNEILVFPNYVSLDEKYAKFIKNESEFLKSYEIQNLGNIQFDVIPNNLKGKLFRSDDFFIITSRYLGNENSTFTKQKNLNLEIESKKHKVIFPTEEDLKEKFVTSPIIVAGNFKSFENGGFKIYYLEKESELLEEMKKASEGMIKSFDFYTKHFGKKDKPKIVFAPFEGRSETNENIIIYNSNIFKKTTRTTISHEMGHIWFGQNGKIFKERPLTEAVTEFIALEYLTSQYGEDKFEKQINFKFYLTEGEKSFKNLSSNLSSNESEILSYNLLPLYLYTKQKNGENILGLLSDFYKYKKDDNTISLDEFNFFLQSKGNETLFTEKIPDFFITKCEDSSNVCVNSTSDKNYDVELEFISNDNQKTKKIVKLEKSKNPQTLETKDVKKITIDPDYKILQVSRLNDIWNKDGDNLFDKNRYFGIDSVKPEIASISNEVANYFTNSENSDLYKKLSLTESQKKDFQELKSKFSNSKNDILTGATNSFISKTNILFLNFAFFDSIKKEINVLKLSLKLNNDYTKLEELKVFD